MGHGPNLNDAVKKSEEAKNAVEAAITKAEATLKNTEQKAKDYINSHTKGIIEIEATNNNSYTKYSDEYSLEILDGIVDGLIKGAQDFLNPTSEATKASEMAGDVGSVVKSTLALFATSSSTNQELQVVFNHIIKEDENYTVYYATNSMNVNASKAWGNKELTVVSNMYLFAKVKPNPEVTHAKILQEDLDTLATLNEQYDKAIINASNQDELDGLNFNQNKMMVLETKIKTDLKELTDDE